MNVRHICVYLGARIGRWNDNRLMRYGRWTNRPGGTPVLWHRIDRLSLRLYRAGNR